MLASTVKCQPVTLGTFHYTGCFITLLQNVLHTAGNAVEYLELQAAFYWTTNCNLLKQELSQS